MAIDLKKITKGREHRPPKGLIYGLHGTGKTTFISGIPGAFVLDTDRGSHKHDVTQRVVPETWTEAKEWLAAIEGGAVKCDALVVDSVTQLEALMHAELFESEGMAAWKGGYGKGADRALMHWREMVALFERIWRQGKTVFLVGHVKIKTFNDPLGPAYDQYLLSAEVQAAGLINQWVDYVLFARERVLMQKTGEDERKAVSGGDVRLYTRGTPAYWAKARGTTLFPESLVLGWQDFMAAVNADDSRSDVLRKEIDELCVALADEKVTAAAKDFLQKNPTALVETRNRLVELFKERKK
jgi:hypothetical protein